MSDIDALLAANPPAPATSRTVVTPTSSHRRHVWVDGACVICFRPQDVALSRRGRQSRNYGNRAELDVARRYGGVKVGHHGGPVDVRGTDFNTQVKTHRRLPPAEWTKVFAGLAASTDRLPRLLLRFVHSTGPTDYIVIPADVWLDWFGKDE